MTVALRGLVPDVLFVQFVVTVLQIFPTHVVLAPLGRSVVPFTIQRQPVHLLEVLPNERPGDG